MQPEQLPAKVSTLPNLEPSTEGKHRTDIQALRGFAVLVVLLYHARLGPMKGGYLGVDVFFVISGFLITTVIATSLANGSFSFYNFYYRRAKRLLPAAYATFFVTAILSPIFLTEIELHEFRRQLIGSVLLVGNIVLWQQTGYFDSAAETKPLLHVWSLAIEEQFYMILPAVLFLLPRRAWLHGAVLVCGVSLILCIAFAPLWPSATFYLLPTRAWELAIGSVGALAVIGPATQKLCSILFFPAIAALLFVHVFPFGGPHPGLDAVLVCVATLIVIIRRSALLERTFVAKCLSKVGDFSYSLYLVHWPIFAFLHSAWIGKIPSHVRFGALLVSLLLGYLLYRFLERPVRRMEFVVKPIFLLAGAIALTALVVAPSALVSTQQSEAGFAFIRRSNYGFGPACDSGPNFNPSQECSNSNAPRVLVWGDSFAMHLVPGLRKSDMRIVQATMAGCGPLLGMAPEISYSSNYNRNWAERCIGFNSSVLEYLVRSPSVQVIVLAGAFWQYLPPNASRILVRAADGYVESEPGIELALSGLRSTIDTVRKLGKRVVIVGPPPSGGFDVGGCLERLASNKVLLGSLSDCQIPRARHEGLNKGVIALLRKAAKDADVEVIRFDDYLCNSMSCSTHIQGTLVYRDTGHLSHQGSELLAAMMRLPELLEKTAR